MMSIVDYLLAGKLILRKNINFKKLKDTFMLTLSV